MKALIIFFAIGFTFVRSSFAQIPVTDVANLSQNILSYATLIEQLAKQAEQISNQVRQIQQMENQLKRLGNMADFKAIVGFPQLRLDLNLPTQIRTWADSVARVDGARIFGDTRGGVFVGINGDFLDFDGGPVARDADVYKPAQEITSSVDNFKDVQSDVYARREQLKQAIARTSDALQAAETDAEEKKLQAVLNAQYSQLAALDSEVGMSAAEIQVKAAEASAMNDAESQADAEARRKLAQQETQKITTTFTPKYECLLQYVTEKPFQP